MHNQNKQIRTYCFNLKLNINFFISNDFSGVTEHDGLMPSLLQPRSRRARRSTRSGVCKARLKDKTPLNSEPV